MARGAALAAAVAVALLAVSGAAGTGAQTPKRGGTVVVNAVGGGPTCLNFLDDRCVAALSFTVRVLVRTTLLGAFDIGPDGTYRPLLVSNVAFATKPPFTLTYHIRPRARWSDGVPVSAADFVFTHRALRKHVARESGDPHLTTVRSVRAVGPKTVRVVLRSRFAGWRNLFDVVLPRHALVGEDLRSIWTDAIDNPKTRRPIGSGPFLIARHERSGPDQRIVLRRNPRYWGPHPAYLDQIVLWWSGLSGSESLAALGNGKLHQTPVPRDVVPDAQRMRGVRLDSFLSGSWEHFEIRLTPRGHPALRSKIVRRALAYGIDRSTIVRELFGEIPRVRPSDSALFLAQSRHYEPNWSVYRYRPERARQLLARAGCPLGPDGIRVCEEGGRLNLRFVTRAGNPSRELTLRLVQAQLRRIGVLVEPIYATQAALFGQVLPSGDFDVALFSWGNTPDASGQADFYACGRVLNFTGYCQRLVTRDLDQADRVLDAERRAQVLNRADAQMARDAPVIPLYQVPVVMASRTAVRGVTFSAFSVLGTTNLENWWLER